MRTKNPGLMTQIQDFVNDFFFREYRMPSVQEIATATGIAKSSAHRYLVEMDKRGILSYRAGEILTDMVNGLSFAIKNTPLTGGITCGIPVEENPRVEEYIPLPTAIFGNKDMFILKAYGDSMTGVGISSGDYVVIQRQTYARPGQIIAALVDHHENTLKRLMYDEKQDRMYLHPENPDFEDMYFNEIEIQGVLANIIKNGPF